MPEHFHVEYADKHLFDLFLNFLSSFFGLLTSADALEVEVKKSAAGVQFMRSMRKDL